MNRLLLQVTASGLPLMREKLTKLHPILHGFRLNIVTFKVSKVPHPVEFHRVNTLLLTVIFTQNSQQEYFILMPSGNCKAELYLRVGTTHAADYKIIEERLKIVESEAPSMDAILPKTITQEDLINRRTIRVRGTNLDKISQQL